ncbi:MAG: methyltransferase domain-containing protein [Saprospiraceae bacterium]
MSDIFEYYKQTYYHKNAIKRYAHQTRVRVAISLLAPLAQKTKVLDFGCGKGYFVHQLKDKINCDIIGYDKYLKSESPLVTNDEDIVSKSNYYDVITCFETLEHCHEETRDKILDKIHSLLKTNGKLLVSVPIEIGPISIFKNLFRFKNALAKHSEFNLKNIIKCAFYNPPKDFRKSQPYPGHFGWDHRDLEKILKNLEGFTYSKKSYSPFSIPSIWINSQVFYLLKKK